MLSKITTASLWGLQAEKVTVEVDLQNGFPSMTLVGLADITIKEAKERIRAAILNADYTFPRKRLTINLSPAGRPKEGSHFDLPIALGILLLKEGKEMKTEDTAFIGELSLDGKVRHVRGALPMAIGLREQGIKHLVLPEENIHEVAVLSDMDFYPVEDLSQAVQWADMQPHKRKEKKQEHRIIREDFKDVSGQENVKRALTIAAAGNHGILMIGSPGVGKSMMAKRIPTILPNMTYEEQLETTKIHSIAGLLDKEKSAILQRPFRAPHHTASKISLVGGGNRLRPGEISLAHNGVLFLDEFGEFDTKLLNLLRQPIEEGQITINRAAGCVTFPCRTMLVAATNPCPCGYLGDETHLCSCSESQLNRYLSRFSGPFIDRIDLHVQVLPVKWEQREQGVCILSSGEMKDQISAAVRMQQNRYAGTNIRFNGGLSPKEVNIYCMLGKEEEALLKQAYETLNLSMRTYHKMIKVARTIADLHQSHTINSYHIAEALQYRTADRLYRRL